MIEILAQLVAAGRTTWPGPLLSANKTVVLCSTVHCFQEKMTEVESRSFEHPWVIFQYAIASELVKKLGMSERKNATLMTLPILRTLFYKNKINLFYFLYYRVTYNLIIWRTDDIPVYTVDYMHHYLV